jgi:signal transduction histidine kinase
MYGYISMLEEGQRLMTDDVIERMLRTTRTRTEHVIKVVEDLMLLAQIDSGLIKLEVETHRKRTAVGQLLESVIRDLRPRAEAKNISLAYTQGDFSVLGVASYIQDILTRLIDNAIKFGTYEGHIQVKMEEQDNAVIIAVQDDGIGIEPEQWVDLYDPRARTEREDLGNGHVGLGLAITRGLVIAHGGDIQVESRSGEGTTFTVTLPAR